MSLRDKFKSTEEWHQKIYIVEIVHNLGYFQKSDWRMEDTARVLAVSTSLVSEDLKLAEAVRNYPELKELSRNQALKKLK